MAKIRAFSPILPVFGQNILVATRELLDQRFWRSLLSIWMLFSAKSTHFIQKRPEMSRFGNILASLARFYPFLGKQCCCCQRYIRLKLSQLLFLAKSKWAQKDKNNPNIAEMALWDHKRLVMSSKLFHFPQMISNFLTKRFAGHRTVTSCHYLGPRHRNIARTRPKQQMAPTTPHTCQGVNCAVTHLLSRDQNEGAGKYAHI